MSPTAKQLSNEQDYLLSKKYDNPNADKDARFDDWMHQTSGDRVMQAKIRPAPWAEAGKVYRELWKSMNTRSNFA